MARALAPKIEADIEKDHPLESGLIIWTVGRAAYPAYLVTTDKVACREPFPNLDNPLFIRLTYN